MALRGKDVGECLHVSQHAPTIEDLPTMQAIGAVLKPSNSTGSAAAVSSCHEVQLAGANNRGRPLKPWIKASGLGIEGG